MIVLYGILGILLLLVLLLLIPIRYRIIGEMWRAHIRVSFLFGLFSMEKTIPLPKKTKLEPQEELAAQDDRPEHMSEEQEKGEAGKVEDEPRSAPAEEAPHGAPRAEEKNRPEGEQNEEPQEKKKPSLARQIRFAIQNGTLSAAAEALGKVIRHSRPERWRVYGRFGTGDPATTGMAAGTCMAFLPDTVSGVEWVYLESVWTLSCEGKGRVIPLYIAYIVIRLAVSRSVREFWQFRSGKRVFPGGSNHER